MKKYILILILFICTLITSCTLPGQNQGNNNNNQNDIYYKVYFDSYYGSFVEPLDVKQGELAIKPVDPTKENFRFLYWTLNNVEYDFNTPVTSNITLVALWEQVGYHVHDYVVTKVEPTCTEKGYTEYICSCGDIFKDSYIDELGHNEEKHPAKSPTSTEIGWEEYVTCTRCSYTTYKEIPVLNNTSIEIYEKDGKKFFNFGSYPQTHVNNNELINELNKLTNVNSRGYYEYNGSEYAKVTTKPCNYGATDYTYSTGKIVVDGITEWFKVEPIVWKILSTSNNIYQVLSEYILDVSCYYHDYDEVRTIDSKTVYANNYKYSDIREFLNNTFLNSAFKSNEQSLIVVTEVDNSASTTYSSSNPYVCENTFDNIYLLSHQDTLNTNYGFSSYNVGYGGEERMSIVTDYAKAMGVWWNTSSSYYNIGYWWLRSPSYDFSYNAGVVNYDGGVYIYDEVSISGIGVRPATTIAIQ